MVLQNLSENSNYSGEFGDRTYKEKVLMHAHKDFVVAGTGFEPMTFGL